MLMSKSDNIFWGKEVVPNLPIQHVLEYMFLLGSYAECRITSVRPKLCPKDSTWCFPFLDVEESFDHGDFEDWIEMVEQDMMDRYNLDEHHFSSW